MAAIPVSSEEKPVNPQHSRLPDQVKNVDKRVTVLERAALAQFEARLAALEAEVFP